MAALAQMGPTRLNRTFWTREATIQGLRRVWLELGAAPTATDRYNELVRYRRGDGPRGRYPSFYAVLRWFPNFRAAWAAASVETDKGTLPWSELEDWYLLEGAGLLTRKELAADLGRSPDAVHRRLYDLGVHTWRRWGWAGSRVEAASGITQAILRRYMRRGELPYVQGTQVLYIDPADLPIVEEIDWQSVSPELARDVTEGLRRRIVATLSGVDWTVGRPHQPHPERGTVRRWSKQALALAPKPRPNDIARRDRVRFLGTSRDERLWTGRVGVVGAVLWSSRRYRVREKPEPGWFARVAFQGPRLHRTLPLEQLERLS
jgi:hypothetical protein